MCGEGDQRNKGVDGHEPGWKNPEADTYDCLSHNPNTDMQIDRACRRQNKIQRLDFKRN